MAFGLLCEMFVVLSLCKRRQSGLQGVSRSKKSTKPSLKRLGFYANNAVFFVRKCVKTFTLSAKKHFKQGFSPCPWIRTSFKSSFFWNEFAPIFILTGICNLFYFEIKFIIPLNLRRVVSEKTDNACLTQSAERVFIATREIFMRGFDKNLKAKSMLKFKIQRISRGLSKTSLALL